MQDSIGTLLIVDNDPSIRFSLSQIFRHLGHHVCGAADGFHALEEIKAEVPDILLSDLNMPRMSGFELLSIVRRRFPDVYVIGMTGGFVDRMPQGIAADSFYRKATGLTTLFALVKAGFESDPVHLRATRAETPIWVPVRDELSSEGKQVLLGCPECLRAFPKASRAMGLPESTHCEYCSAPIHYAVVEQFV